MDVATSAYEQGAESVVVVDVVKPVAFAKEIRRLEDFGGKIVWPFVTKKITTEGIFSDDGRFITADQVIVSIGEAPVLDFLPEVKKFRDWLVPDAEKKILPKVFAAGDVIQPERNFHVQTLQRRVKRTAEPSSRRTISFCSAVLFHVLKPDVFKVA